MNEVRGFLNPVNYRSFTVQHYDRLLLDTNWNCNLHCRYCVNPRSSAIIPTDWLQTTLPQCNMIQLGCGMEPTKDFRGLSTLLPIVKAKAQHLTLQTNGVVLGLYPEVDLLSASVDSLQPHIFAQLRGGASLPKVIQNICQYERVQILCTVTSLNIEEIPDLIIWALDSIEAVRILFRQVFHEQYHADLDVPDEHFALFAEQFARDGVYFYTRQECLDRHETFTSG